MSSDPDSDGVTHADGILRFHVASRSHSGETHLVDLGTKECTCRWHLTSVAPALRRGERPRRWCYHMDAARRAFTEWAIAQFKAADKNYQ